MRGLPEPVTRDGTAPSADVDRLVIEGRFGRADLALRRIEALIPSLAQSADGETLMLALYGRAVLLRQLGAGTQDAIAACDILERAAVEGGWPLWGAVACALRARVRVEGDDIGGATGDLARADAVLATENLATPTGYRLLDALALVYARLRLYDRLDEVRDRLERSVDVRSVVEQALHWSNWAGELAARAMEPLAGGAADPQHEFLEQAVTVAARLDDLPADDVPATLRRGARGVRALAAAYRGKPSEALRLLGQDAFGAVADLPLVERQVVSLAAMRAHALVGSLATARSLDDAASTAPAALPHLVLEVCRTRERLWLETYAGGDVIPVLHRMTELLVRLGWRGMNLVADTARQALEHQALRAESRTDALTGVGNRRALDEELRQLLRFGSLPLALVLVDIDHFKEVNDRFTHVVGDEVLRRVAASLALQLRTDDRLLRYGGDEFVVLLPGTGDEEANAVAERMAAAVAARPWQELAGGLHVTVTTGCAAVWSLTGRRPDSDAETLFRRADERLLAAKRRRPAYPDAGAGDRERARRGHVVELYSDGVPDMTPARVVAAALATPMHELPSTVARSRTVRAEPVGTPTEDPSLPHIRQAANRSVFDPGPDPELDDVSDDEAPASPARAAHREPPVESGDPTLRRRAHRRADTSTAPAPPPAGTPPADASAQTPAQSVWAESPPPMWASPAEGEQESVWEPAERDGVGESPTPPVNIAPPMDVAPPVDVARPSIDVARPSNAPLPVDEAEDGDEDDNDVPPPVVAPTLASRPRRPVDPPTTRTAIIDLSARKRNRGSPYP